MQFLTSYAPSVKASTSDEDDLDDLPSATALPAAATGTTSTPPTTPSAADNCCRVRLIGQRDGVALVPRGPHAFLRYISVEFGALLGELLVAMLSCIRKIHYQ